MRDNGKMVADLHYYVPQDEEDYFIQTGKLPKALAAHAANADLNGIRVPQRQDDVLIRMHKVLLCNVLIWLTTLQDLELLKLLLIFLLLST